MNVHNTGDARFVCSSEKRNRQAGPRVHMYLQTNESNSVSRYGRLSSSKVQIDAQKRLLLQVRQNKRCEAEQIHPFKETVKQGGRSCELLLTGLLLAASSSTSVVKPFWMDFPVNMLFI